MTTIKLNNYYPHLTECITLEVSEEIAVTLSIGGRLCDSYKRRNHNRFPIKIIHLENACIRACPGKDVFAPAIRPAVSYPIQNCCQNKQGNHRSRYIFFLPRLFVCIH